MPFFGKRYVELALGDDVTLTGPTAAEIDAQVVLGKGDAGWATVDDDDVTRTVRFAGGGDAEGLTEAIARHERGGAYYLKPFAHSHHETD